MTDDAYRHTISIFITGNCVVLHLTNWHKALQAADGFVHIRSHRDSVSAVLVSLLVLW